MNSNIFHLLQLVKSEIVLDTDLIAAALRVVRKETSQAWWKKNFLNTSDESLATKNMV